MTSRGNESRRDRAAKCRARYYLFLNSYVDAAFTRCPQCDRKTKVRMFCLLIHIEPRQLVSFNKSCRFCTACEIIIVKKAELEAYLAQMCEARGRPEIIGNEYIVIGTIDRALHRKGKKGGLDVKTAAESCTPFRNQLEFRPRGGWELPGG